MNPLFHILIFQPATAPPVQKERPTKTNQTVVQQIPVEILFFLI
jgi:hypothetical protein